MQVTVTNNNGIIAETIEGGEFILSSEGVKKVENTSTDNSVKTETRNFAFQMNSGHSPEDIAKAMDGLRVACGGRNAAALARKLVEMNDDGYIQIGDERPADIYEELSRCYGLPFIKEKTFREALRDNR